jgi:histidyl-tRNA synthetase
MASISGFPEFTPQGRFVEMRAIDLVRRVFELHGFTNIQTRSIEPLSELSRKGEITQEVYLVRRLHGQPTDEDQWGLHFDLTIPFARYVLDHAGHLEFPFRRYQIQPAWRGERPQEGRFREFWQADIDIVGQGELGSHHDAEVALVMLEVCQSLTDELGLPPVLMRINHRQLIQGFYLGLGIDDPLPVIQAVDKLPKIGEQGVEEILLHCGLDSSQIDKILAFAQVSSTRGDVGDQVRALAQGNEILDLGLTDLMSLYSTLQVRYPSQVVIDAKIARGLDYYTGAVFEIELQGSESLGTIAAGGRYDSLATDGKTTYPGVGLSFGLSRVFVPLITQGKLVASRLVPSVVLIALDSPETREQADEVAGVLRQRGIPCEVSPNAAKYGKQIRFADRRGIPYVWFGSLHGEVKDIRSGDQESANATTWNPPAGDMSPQILRN